MIVLISPTGYTSYQHKFPGGLPHPDAVSENDSLAAIEGPVIQAGTLLLESETNIVASGKLSGLQLESVALAQAAFDRPLRKRVRTYADMIDSEYGVGSKQAKAKKNNHHDINEEVVDHVLGRAGKLGAELRVLGGDADGAGV